MTDQPKRQPLRWEDMLYYRTADLRYGPLDRRYPLQPARPLSDEERRVQVRDERNGK